MNIITRLATLNDVKSIVDIHCSDIEKWFKETEGQKVEARYEDLSIEERYIHGGPWMTTETCAIHLNNLLVNGQYPLVAELNNRVVGELELYIGEEKGPLGRCGYIDILEVHRDYRGRGVGRALINKAIEIARNQKCQTIAVWPTQEATPFYIKCGINQTTYIIHQIELDLTKIHPTQETIETKPIPTNQTPTKTKMHLITPRIYTSTAAWLKTQWKYSLQIPTKTIQGYIATHKAIYTLQTKPNNPTTAYTYLWVKDTKNTKQALNTTINIAIKTGIKKLRLYITPQTQNHVKYHPHKHLTTETLLTKKLHK